MIRFNHMEITVPRGFCALHRREFDAFFLQLFDFLPSVFPGLEESSLVYRTDAAASQFLFIAEHDLPAPKLSDDHLGFHLDSARQVEDRLASCLAFQASHPGMEIRDLGILDLTETRTRAFYVRYLLPLWFDIQHIEYKPGFEPVQAWSFGPA